MPKTQLHSPLAPCSVPLIAMGMALACSVPEALSAADGRTLSSSQWGADLDQTLAAIEEHHPAPYRHIDKEEFATATEALRTELPALSDREVVVRLTELMALLEDGHSRIFLPRQHPELAPALEAGHSGTDPPRHPALALRQLPVRFGLFSDGVFIVQATTEHSDLVGQRVVSIGGTEIDVATEQAFRTIAAGNNSRRRTLLPDRLALPDVLATTGITETPGRTDIVVVNEAGKSHGLTLSPLGAAPARLVGGPETAPLWLRNTTAAGWYEVLPDHSAIFVQVNEIEASPQRPWASFLRETLDKAREADVDRYVLDLRHNAGGRGTWITPFINALAGSEYDQYGRLLILMGGHTFSAAQMLVNQFERYTDACFIGESSGAPPTHYGDSKKVVLANSGLTVRVSSLYWPSWLGGDFRQATSAHVDAIPTAADYFAGRDPVLEAALSYDPPADIGSQVEDLLRRDKTQAAALRYLRHISDPRIESRDPGEMAAAGHRLLDDGLVPAGRMIFVLLSQLYADSAPAQTGLGRSMELSGDADAARSHYDQALSLDADYQPAREALERLGRAD